MACAAGFRLLVVGFDDAHVGHGGEGALYVRLRRAAELPDSLTLIIGILTRGKNFEFRPQIVGRVAASSGNCHVRNVGEPSCPKPSIAAESRIGAADASDGRVLAEVEKWMAMIREISREQVKN